LSCGYFELVLVGEGHGLVRRGCFVLDFVSWPLRAGYFVLDLVSWLPRVELVRSPGSENLLWGVACHLELLAKGHVAVRVACFLLLLAKGHVAVRVACRLVLPMGRCLVATSSWTLSRGFFELVATDLRNLENNAFNSNEADLTESIKQMETLLQKFPAAPEAWLGDGDFKGQSSKGWRHHRYVGVSSMK
jgi:hypothetical protein